MIASSNSRKVYDLNGESIWIKALQTHGAPELRRKLLFTADDADTSWQAWPVRAATRIPETRRAKLRRRSRGNAAT